MPMKPAAPESIAPMAKPIATSQDSRNQSRTNTTIADDGDGRVLAAQIGLRALAHRAGNLLHALRAGGRRHHLADVTPP